MIYNEDLKSLQISEKEAKSIDAYRGLAYKLINSLLELGLKNETEINTALEFIPYNESSVKDALKIITESYSAMVKNSYKHNSEGMQLYRGTTQEEISRADNSKNIGRFLSTTTSKEMAEGYFSVNWKNPAVVYVHLNDNIPYIQMSDVIEDYGNNWEKEVLLAPFTKIDGLKEISRYNGKNYYNLGISKQELPEIDEKDRKSMYKEILDSSNEMGNKLKEYFSIQKDMDNLAFRRETIVRNLSGQGLDMEDRKYLSEQIHSIDKQIEDIYTNRNKYVSEISDWKSKIISYCKAECREVEKNIEHNAKQEQHEIKIAQEKERVARANNILSGIKTNCLSQIGETINMSSSMQHKLEDISNDQYQYEETANKFGLKYTRWCKSEEDKQALNHLTNKLNEIKQKIQEYDANIQSVDTEYPSKKDELDKLLSMNREIHDQLSQVQSKNLNGSDERELNGLKKSIMDRFVELKAESDIKKLEDSKDKINAKSGFRKIIDKLTGQEKVDEFQKDQIEKQKRMVRTTLSNTENSNGVDDTKKYSVHEIVSKMDKYILDNKDNDKLKTDIQEIITLRENVCKMFRVNESQVKSLMGKDMSKQLLPLDNKKIDKMTKIKMESDKWIIENGYDSKDKKDIKFELRKTEDNIKQGILKIAQTIELSLDSVVKSQEIVKNGDNCKE